jgi:hypothetical protein
VLTLSLLGNAVAVGTLMRFREIRTELLGPGAQITRLPREVRQDLALALRQESGTLLPLVRAMSEARERLIAAATARPYNRATTEAAMEDFRATIADLLAAMQPVLLDRLDTRSSP